MKIFYDHLCFWQQYGGVPKYFIELIKRLPPDSYILSVLFSNNHYLKTFKTHIFPFFPNSVFRGKASIEQILNEPFTTFKLFKEKFDIYHQTHYNPYAFKYLSQNTIRVTTMHDMNFFKIPHFYPSNIRLIKHQKISAQKADRIVAVSENTKKDLVDIWNINPRKIATIYHGIDFLSIEKMPLQRNIDSPFILYVGERLGYKNFKNLVIAFSKFVVEYKSVKLVCAGKKFSNEEMELFRKYKINSNMISLSVTDFELYQLYKTALMFVYPSFYEGFGIPLLEAMACKCPMAISNTSCFPEIACKGALYFDPFSIDDIYDKMRLIIESPDVRNSLIHNGSIRVKDFSIENMVEKHMKLYRSCL